MIAYSYIERNIRSLDVRYRDSTTVQDANYYSKLAILELCGWIEVSMDDAIIRAGNRVLNTAKSKKFLEEKVHRNYGFQYNKHFKSMIVTLVGIAGYELIEKSIDTAILLNFVSELGTLNTRRNSLAHTYTRGITPHYDAPSITLSRLQKVTAGLKAYDNALRKHC